MYISKLTYIWNSGKYYMENICSICKEKPAISLEADCHGDNMNLCKRHWIDWFNGQLLPAFEKPIEDEHKLVMTEKYGAVYE